MPATKTNSNTPFWAALAASLATDILLRGQAAYPPRLGALAALVTVPGLALLVWAFGRCWHCSHGPLVRLVFAFLLVLATLREILTVQSVLQQAYPGLFRLGVVGILLLLPVLYLRRSISLCQTGRVLLWLLVAAGVLLVVAVAPRLRVTNLQIVPLERQGWYGAVRAQFVIYPEYLLPALLVTKQNQKGRGTPLLPLFAVGLDVALHFMLELFFGAALQNRSMPLHTAASSGALSIFNRLEWVQLVLCCAVVSLKLALYLYGITVLARDGTVEGESVDARHFLLYVAAVLVLCLLLQQSSDALEALYHTTAWVLVALVWIGGATGWLCKRERRCC